MTRLDEIESRAESMTRSGSGTMTVDVSDIRLLVAVARAAFEYMEAPPSANVKAAIKMSNALAPLLAESGEGGGL